MLASRFKSRWYPDTGRAIVKKKFDDLARSLNAYLDTLQAKVHEAWHQLLMSGKPVTAESVRNMVQGRAASEERPHLLLEIFQYHNDQVKALLGKEYSKGTLTKFNTVLKHTRSFLQWKYKMDDIDIRRSLRKNCKRWLASNFPLNAWSKCGISFFSAVSLGWLMPISRS